MRTGHQYHRIAVSIKLLGYNCQGCGSDKNINLHHIDGNPRNNNPSNWQRLCASCHKTLHSKYYGMLPSIKKQIQKEKRVKWYKEHQTINIPAGYIRTREVCEMLNVSRETINNHPERYKGIMIYSPKTTKKRAKGIMIYPIEQIKNIARAI